MRVMASTSGARTRVVDPRGTGIWPKETPELTDEQREIRTAFMARWLEVLPTRYGMIERFNHTYAAAAEPNGRTLEIGAGVGEHLRYEDLTRQEYHAVELRAELAKELQEHFPEVTALVADCQQTLPFADGFFDRVLAVHVLEHLPDLPSALDEVARVLASDGRFMVVIPCEGGLAYSMARRISAQRLFEREYGTSYEWFIRSEHVNVPWEIVGELRKRFRLDSSTYFPLRVPWMALNLAIGLQLSSLKPTMAGPPNRRPDSPGSGSR
jgi:SAM-dependent methyltransferase